MLVKIPLRVLGSPELSTSAFRDVTWSLGPHIHIQIAGILDTKKGKTYNLLKFVDMYILIPSTSTGQLCWGGGMENRPIIKTLLAVSYRKTISYLHITSSKYYSRPGGCSHSSGQILGKSWLTSLLCHRHRPAASTLPISHTGGGCHEQSWKRTFAKFEVVQPPEGLPPWLVVHCL